MESATDPKSRAIWFALFVSASLGLSTGLFYLSPSSAGPLIRSLLLPVIGFSAVASAVRWFVQRRLAANVTGRLFLLVVGAAKIVLMLALPLLLLECLLFAMVRPGTGKEMFGTFINGLIAVAVLSIALGGVTNSLIIVRRLLNQ